MRTGPLSFLLPEGADAASSFASIRIRLPGELEPSSAYRRRFFDSFDWSLYRAAAALEERTCLRASSSVPRLGPEAGWGQDPGSDLGLDRVQQSSQPPDQQPGQQPARELIWLDLGNAGAVVARQAIDADPGFAGDLPPGPVQELLAPVLGIRRLLPMVEMDTQAQTMRVLNEDDKTIARIVIEQTMLADAARGRHAALPARLRLLPVRGYDVEFAETAATLAEVLTLEPEHVPLVLEALAASGRRPGAYSSRLDYRLDPGQRADAAAKAILLGLLETLEANIDGSRRNLDSEFLHDLRVATRRTRSALSQIKGVFAPRLVNDFKAGFAWLQQITGPVRDLDVHLLDFPRLRGRLPTVMRDDLEPLRDWLAGHYDGEQRRLVEALDSPRFASLMRDWRAFLESPLPRATAELNAALPIKVLADQRIWRMFKRVRREGRAIRDASPAEDLHELRKSCKKLRYLMEFFQSLYPADEVRGLIKQTKLLLDNLGGFQDLAVQADHLRETAERMHAEGAADVATLLAMGALTGDLLQGQQQARREFARIFAGFDSKANGQRFRRLFKADLGSDAASDATADPSKSGDGASSSAVAVPVELHAAGTAP
jgi:CHAD domain-containing protein